jgi:hypothetical protein
MIKAHTNSVVAALFAVATCVGFTAAHAADSSEATTASVPLRGEIAVQYKRSTGMAANAGQSTEVCEPSTTSDGNAQNGSLHCNSLLTKPVHLNVQLNGAKVDLPITTVGTQKLNLSGIVDTGSGGLTLNAFQVFPSSMVTSSGFNFNGQNQIVYNGITVTKLVATRGYGGQGVSTTRTGNLGFAHVTFGEKGEVTTALVPILFVYASTRPPSATSGDLDNTIGINGGMDAIGNKISFDGNAIDEGSEPSNTVYPECTKQSTSQCSLFSPLRSLNYSPELQAGYILSNFPLVNLQQGRYLTIGLDEHNTEGFASKQLDCSTSSLNVEDCNQIVHDVKIVTSAGLSFTWNVIFDSGRPTVGLTMPVDSSTPPAPTALPANQTVTVTPPNQAGYVYSFTTGTGFAATTLTSVNQNASDADQTYGNMGLEFFATNSLMLDYDNGVEGWKHASTTP